MPITLLDCIFRRSHGDLFAAEPHEQDIDADCALIGIHLADESSAAFTGIELEMENLNAWASTSDLMTGFGDGESRNQQITMQQGEPRTAALGHVASSCVMDIGSFNSDDAATRTWAFTKSR